MHVEPTLCVLFIVRNQNKVTKTGVAKFAHTPHSADIFKVCGTPLFPHFDKSMILLRKSRIFFLGKNINHDKFIAIPQSGHRYYILPVEFGLIIIVSDKF